MSLPVPYFQTDDVTLYQGDCLEILPTLGKVDAVVTDPPYGISLNTRNGSRGRGGRPYWSSGRANDYSPIHGDDKQFDPLPIISVADRGCVWGANNYAASLQPSAKWLVWDKKAGKAAKSDLGDCELAYTWGTPHKAVRMFSHMWAGFQRDSEVGQKHLHPTQKPIALMEWCIEQVKVPDGGVVLDPYMGAGATGVACVKTGRKFIGIELDPAYCEIAKQRIEKALSERGQAVA